LHARTSGRRQCSTRASRQSSTKNVAAYATYPGYTERQRLAIEYAERFANAHGSIDDAFFGRLRELFSDEEILDLTLCVAVFLGLGRSLAVLGVDQSCAIDV
jgi:alkylhydroperoxidase family enzyme